MANSFMLAPRANFGTATASPGAMFGSPRGRQRPRSAGFGTMMFAQGGAVPTEEDNPLMHGMGSTLQLDINAAVQAARGVLDYGRKLHGLPTSGGEDDGEAINTAGAIPTKPGTYSPNMPEPMMPPTSLPYGPNEKPFGKRTSENEGEPQEQQVASAMPGTPFRETPVPQPMPKPDAFPYRPGETPFGKRSENEEPADEEASETPQQEMAEGAIDTDEETA